MSKLTQKEIILRELEVTGEDGIHSFSFYKNFMPTFSQRIGELIREGYNIVRINNGNKGARYILNK